MILFLLFFVVVHNTSSIVQDVGLYDCTAVSTYLEVDSLELISKPIFPGCEFEEREVSEACSESSLIRFIQSELNCPFITKEEVPSSRIVFKLLIDKEGDVFKIEFLKGEDHPCRNVLEEVTKKIPQMIPAKKNSIPVEYVYSIPLYIKFK